MSKIRESDIPPPDGTVVYIKVYIGGVGSTQIKAFKPALAAVKAKYERKHNIIIKASYLSEEDLKNDVRFSDPVRCNE
jgi:hypothetical protein